MNRPTSRIGFLVLLIIHLLFSLTATLTAKSALTKEQVTTIVTASKFGITPERAVELIRERGISFAVTDVFLKKLEAMEADSTILKTLEELGRKRKATFQPAVAPGTIKMEPMPEKAPPVPPKLDLLPPGTAPTTENWDQFLESVRATVLDYTDDLPNFVCNQGTRQYQAIGRRGWTPRGNFEVEVAYYNKSPHYKQISQTNFFRPVGEFGSALRGLFAPSTRATFKLQGLEKKHGLQTARLAFQVPRNTSPRSLSVKDKGAVSFGYRGHCWIDLKSYLVIRLESESTDIPQDAPITDEQLVLRYKEVMLANDLFWLPAELHVIVKTNALADGGLDAVGINEGGHFEATQKVSLRYVSFFRHYRPFEPQ